MVGERSTAVLDIKRNARRNVVFGMYITGKYSQQELADMLQVNRETIWNDLKWCEENTVLDLNPQDAIKSALMQLNIDRMKLIQEADDIRDYIETAEPGKISPTQRAALHKTVGDLIQSATLVNVKILERFTQTSSTITSSSKADQRTKDTLQFFVDRFGTECLDGYKEYMEAAESGRGTYVEKWTALRPKPN